MEIIERSQIFNDNFRKYIKGDTSDYLAKLLEFASEEDNIESTLEERTKEFQQEVLGYVLSQETKDDFETDVDEVRKDRIEDLLYDVNNYLYSIEPYEAVKIFVEGNFKDLFIKSTIYCSSYRKSIIEKVQQIINNAKLEYEQNIVYKDALNLVLEHMVKRSNEIILYESMKKSMVHINKNTSLKEYEEYVDSLLLESAIIKKFDKNGRNHISSVINKTVQHPELGETTHYMANICESILTNYVLLDLYSCNPESLKVSDNMLKSIMMEVDMGSITKDDIINTIENGPVSFIPEEIDYINRTFINRMFHNEEKNTVNKVDLLKLVK